MKLICALDRYSRGPIRSMLVVLVGGLLIFGVGRVQGVTVFDDVAVKNGTTLASSSITPTTVSTTGEITVTSASGKAFYAPSGGGHFLDLSVPGDSTFADVSYPNVCQDTTTLTGGSMDYYLPVCNSWQTGGPAPTAATATIWSLAPTADTTITSIGGNDPLSTPVGGGRWIQIQNDSSSHSITLANESLGVNAQNRIDTPTGTDAVIAPGFYAWIWYATPTATVTDARFETSPTLPGTSGGNVVYRCTSAGAVRSGVLTTVSADCGSSIDTGLRVP